MTGHPAYGELRTGTATGTGTASVLHDGNPGTSTLGGTNTWLLRAPGSPAHRDARPDDRTGR